MFAKAIVLSDAFLDMPMSARCLYFTLGMLADDDGFIGNPKAIMRQCGASQDDMLTLLQKRYVLDFESGVIVIKHWRMNNYLQSDRIKKTTYIEEKATLTLDAKGSYTEKEKEVYTDTMYTESMYTQNSIDKNRVDKNSIGESKGECFQEFIDIYPKKTRNLIQLNGAYLTECSRIDEKKLLEAATNYAEACSILQTDSRYIKNPANFLSDGTYLDYLDENYQKPQAKAQKPVKQNAFNTFPQNQYDFDALERQLVNK